MNREEAVKLIGATPTVKPGDPKQKQTVLKGLQLLAKYNDDLDLDIAFEHDQIYVCDFDSLIEKMTREEIIEMASCGWFLAEDSWSHY